MAYTPHVWVPRLGSNLNRFTKANETETSVDLTNAPEIVTQAGTPFSTDIMNEMEAGITDANAGIGLLATCDTAAATQIKEIDMSDYTIKAGMHIDIDFTYGNTVGSVEDGGIASGANIVTKGAGELIRIVGKNGTFLFNEKIGGEYAGSGCHNAGDCHEMVITSMATGNTSASAGVIKNKDAKYIYSVTGENYSYSKDTNGYIGSPIKTEGSPDSTYSVHRVRTLEGIDQCVLLSKIDNVETESKKGFSGNIIISRGGKTSYSVDGFITGFLTKAYNTVNHFFSGSLYSEGGVSTYTYGRCRYNGEYYLYLRFSGAVCWVNCIGVVYGGWVGVSVPSAECSDFSNN